MESAGQFSEASAAAESAVQQYGDHPDLGTVIERLAREVQDQARAMAIQAAVKKIRAAIAEGRFEHASADLAAARSEFGSASALEELPGEIQKARRAADLKRLEVRFQDHLSRHDFQSAAGLLARTRSQFSDESAWQN